MFGVGVPEGTAGAVRQDVFAGPVAAAPTFASTRRLFRDSRLAPWALVCADLAVLQLSVVLAYWGRLALVPWFPDQFPPETYQGMAVGMLVLPAAYAFAQLYPGYRIPPVERLRRRVWANALVFGLLISWDYLVQNGLWSRGILVGTFFLVVVLSPMAEGFVRWLLIRAGRWGQPVVLVGAGTSVGEIAELLRSHPELGMVPIAHLVGDPEKWGEEIDGIPVLGPWSQSAQAVRRAKLAIVAAENTPSHKLTELSATLPFPRVIVVPGLTGLQSLWVEARDLGGVLGLEVKKNLILKRNRALKAFLDYAMAVPLLVFALPLLLCLIVAVKAISPGPAFYTQERRGLYGRKIRILKLRSMHLNADARLEAHLDMNPLCAEEWRRYFKLRNDPRVIPWIGSFLRKSSLDELPQLWNIAKGEMSLVGPRPFPDYHLAAFDPDFQDFRQSVKPGLTGLWQVSSRSDGDVGVQKALDTYYIRNWSPWLDLHILFRTILAVSTARGAH